MSSGLESINGLIAFARSAESKGFAAAGRKLGISASAVGKSIARLESRLGVRLFHRTTRSVTLTEEGKILYTTVSDVLDTLSEAEAQFAGMTAKPTGKLHISSPIALGQFMLMPVLDKLAIDYPDLTFDVDLDDRQVHLVEEGYDLAIRMAPSFDDSRLISRKLGEQTLITCASRDYLLRYDQPMEPQSLSDHRCIGFKFSGTNRPAPWRFMHKKRTYNESVSSQFTVNNNAAMRELVINGAGIGQLPAYVISEDLKVGSVKEVLSDWQAPPLDIVALWPQTKHMSPKLRVLIDSLLDAFSDTKL